MDNNRQPVRTKYLETVIDSFIALKNKYEDKTGEEYDIRNLTFLNVRKHYHLERKRIKRNFEGIGGLYDAVADNVKRLLETYIETESSVTMNETILWWNLEKLKAKRKEIEFSILSGDGRFWEIILSAFEPYLRNTWLCKTETAYNYSIKMFAGVFEAVMSSWLEKDFDDCFRAPYAHILQSFVLKIKKMNEDMPEGFPDNLPEDLQP